MKLLATICDCYTSKIWKDKTPLLFIQDIEAFNGWEGFLSHLDTTDVLSALGEILGRAIEWCESNTNTYSEENLSMLMSIKIFIEKYNFSIKFEKILLNFSF